MVLMGPANIVSRSTSCKKVNSSEALGLGKEEAVVGGVSRPLAAAHEGEGLIVEELTGCKRKKD